MRIAQIAPLYESVPPKCYGGTERVVSYLTEELIRQGHEVTLFASGDSITEARLVAPCPRSLRLNKNCIDSLAVHYRMLAQVFEDTSQFDVLHFHVDYLHFPFSCRQTTPHVTTLHGRLDIPELAPLYDVYRDVPVISISDDQRRPLPQAHWLTTVHHGLPENLLHQSGGGGEYLAFLGRISPEKGVDRAVEIAKRCGMKLKIAAKLDVTDQAYFHAEIEPLLKLPFVEYVGEINEHEKNDFLGKARALLFPVDWPEPFGLVMIEAMACGLPVIAWRCGSVPEVIDHGVTGFVVDNLDDAVKAVDQVSQLSRGECRRVFEERFGVSRMARDYVKAYQRLLETKVAPSNGRTHLLRSERTGVRGERREKNFGKRVAHLSM